jgi:hypothetical protein
MLRSEVVDAFKICSLVRMKAISGMESVTHDIQPHPRFCCGLGPCKEALVLDPIVMRGVRRTRSPSLIASSMTHPILPSYDFPRHEIRTAVSGGEVGHALVLEHEQVVGISK